jgi:hypothetical protein
MLALQVTSVNFNVDIGALSCFNIEKQLSNPSKFAGDIDDLMRQGVTGPVNLGNLGEFTVR